MNTRVDHPEFTALAIGETIDSSAAQDLAGALRHDPSARQAAADLHSAAAALRHALTHQPQPGLDDARRQRILHMTPAEAAEWLRDAEPEEVTSSIKPLRFSRNQLAPSQGRIWLGVAAGAAIFILLARLIPTGKSPTTPVEDPLADAVRLSSPVKPKNAPARTAPSSIPTIATAPAEDAPSQDRSTPLPPLPRVAPGVVQIPVSPPRPPAILPPPAASPPADSRAYSSPKNPDK